MPSRAPTSFFPLPDPPRMPRRHPHALAKVVSVLGILGTLLLATLVIAIWRFDLNGFKPQVEAAMRAATGRDFTIDGRLSVVSYFAPTVAADRVVLGNLPGAAQPVMARVARIEADLNLRALLAGRIEIARLVVIAPDVLLETDAKGVPNWRFTPQKPAVASASPAPASPPPASPTPATTAPPPARPALGVRTVHVKEGRVTWHDGRTGANTVIGIKRLSATETSAASQIEWVADLALDSGRVQVTGQTGPLMRLLDPDATTPWSVYLHTALPGARITLAGSLRRPQRAAGYDMLVDASITDPTALAALLGLPVPPLRGIVASARLADVDGRPVVSAGSVLIGSSNLDGFVRGLRLDRARIAAPGPDQPVQVELQGTLNDQPLQASATLGTLAMLQPALLRRGGFMVDASATLADSRVAAKGRLGRLDSGAGMDLLVSARIRDLTAFAPFVDRALPPLHDLSFSGHLTDGPGGYADGLSMPDMVLRMPEGDLEGSVQISLAPRPTTTARLRGARLDLDALRALLADYTLVPLPPGPPPAALPIPRTVRPAIPDDPVDFSVLTRGDADVTLDLGELRALHLPFKDVAASLALKDGRLLADPVQAQLPGGPVALRLAVDAHGAVPRLALRLHAPGLSVRPLLDALDRTEDITGTMELNADLHAEGRSPHAWAGSATGHLGAALVDGAIDNAVLTPLFSGVLRVARLPPDLMFGPGRSRLRCVALRVDSAGGIATLSSFLLDADRALVPATGTLHLGDETVDIRLRPTLRVGGPGIVVPLTLRGSFRSPVLAIDRGGLVGEALSGLSVGKGLRLPAAPAGPDACGPALALARGAAASAVAPAPPTPSVPLPPTLRGLFR
ncbi:MAG: AsmA family protein [Rhodospirillales bacterium]|nr:AsmA family protein [Rhodospirillales bacterium]